MVSKDKWHIPDNHYRNILCSFFFSRFIAATNDLINFYYRMFFIDEQEVGWPTPNGITLEQATEYCRNYVLQSASGSLCKGVNNVQLDTSLENCVEDIQVGPGTSFIGVGLNRFYCKC